MKSLKSLRWFVPILAAAGPGAYANWNFVADFSVTNGNPNGSWSYGIKNPADLGGSLSLFPDAGSSASFLSWTNQAIINLGAPAVALNISGSAINGVGPGQSVLHPGANNEIATVRWTAPTAGLFQVTGRFWAGDGGAVDLYTYDQGSATLTTVSAATADHDFGFQANLVQGQSLDFMVGNAGSFFYDSTPLDVDIEAVPEPVSLAGLLIGSLLGLARKRR